MAYAKFEDERDDRREPEDENRNRKKGGLRAFFAPENRPALMALSMGITSAARGGDFGTGLARGMQMMELQNENRQRQEQAQRLSQYISGLPEDEKALAMLNPQGYATEKMRSQFSTPKTSPEFLKYRELIGMGKSPDEAFLHAYGGKAMRFRSGDTEFYQGPAGGMSEKFQSEFQKTAGREDANIFSKMRAEATEANNQLAITENLTALLDAGVRTGPIESMTLPFKQIARNLGVPDAIIDREQLSNQEAFRTITNQMALRLRNPESGLGLTGNTSNRDLEFLKQSVPGLDKSDEGNRIIIDMYNRAQRRRIEAARLAEQYQQQYGSLVGFSEYLAQWAEANPLFNDSDRQAVARISSSQSAQAGQGGGGRLRYNAETGELEPMQ